MAGKAKPHPDFPLFRHATGRWCKKIRGRFHYFGKVADDPDGQAALARWLEEKDDLLAGRTPRPKADGFTVRELCDRFMASRQLKMQADELTAASFKDYYDTCRRIIGFFGAQRLVADLAADDFERFRAAMAKGWSPVTLGTEITRVRVIFKYAEDNRLVDGRVHFGTEFRRPKKKFLRADRYAKQQANGKRMFVAEELRMILAAARQPIRAMILLAINCGFGNTDIMGLPISAVNLDTAWVEFPRSKTAILRGCPLWSETVAAIREVLAHRPRPEDRAHDGLLFLTRYGKPWGRRELRQVSTEAGGEPKLVANIDDPVYKEFTKLLTALGLKRRGLGFYAIRHTFETIGGGSRDQVAVDAIMGHADDSMAAVYREEIGEDRLRAVVEHVHRWLFPPQEKP